MNSTLSIDSGNQPESGRQKAHISLILAPSLKILNQEFFELATTDVVTYLADDVVFACMRLFLFNNKMSLTFIEEQKYVTFFYISFCFSLRGTSFQSKSRLNASTQER